MEAEELGTVLWEQVRHVRRALGDLVIAIDFRQWSLGADMLADFLDTNTLRASMPVLDPPLSATIAGDRDERF